MNRLNTLCTLSLVLIAAGCADSGKSTSNNDSYYHGGDNDGPGGAGDAPEVELEFEFAQPAVVGPHVFVANESLNSVAVIDSRSLAIRTVPVGFNPTVVRGPSIPAEGARVFVLNKGSSSVSVVDPAALTVKSVDVLRHANSLDVSQDGSWAIAWFDEDQLEAGETAGDLSAASLVRADGASFALAVGFGVDRVEFTADGGTALIVSDDGVSVVARDAVTADTLIAPIAVLPPAHRLAERADWEVALAPDGTWSVARVAGYDGLVLTELSTGAQWLAPLPGEVSDLDWVAGATPRILAMLGVDDQAVLATVPDGLMALSDLVPPPVEDMGSGADMGATDMGPVADVGSADAGAADMGLDLGGDAGVPDATTEPAEPTMPVAGVWLLPLAQPDLGAAEVSPDGARALLFSTRDGRRGAALLDLETRELRGLAFEKGVRGAVSNDDGTRFVVLHTREPGDIPAGASPSDPEYIARSWGLSIVDVPTTATRLVLTELEPAATTLWQGDPSEQLYMVFAPQPERDASRDVLRVDLDSFAVDTFRVASLPEGVGRIDAAGRTFVNQAHPQGRITFVDVATLRRQTVTGYQLNSGID